MELYPALTQILRNQEAIMKLLLAEGKRAEKLCGNDAVDRARYNLDQEIGNTTEEYMGGAHTYPEKNPDRPSIEPLNDDEIPF